MWIFLNQDINRKCYLLQKYGVKHTCTGEIHLPKKLSTVGRLSSDIVHWTEEGKAIACNQ